MRVAFMGKGGSGKTTIAGAFTRHLAATATQPVLAVDGDLNMHMAGALQMSQRELHRDAEAIGKWLEPELSKEMPIIGVTPPTRSARFIHLSDDDEFLDNYATWNADRSIALLTVGTYEADNAGSHCYHVKLEIAEMLMHRTLDNPGQWVVNDSTAGIDSIGTSLYFASDANVFVVEPTAKSVSVFKDFANVSTQFGLATYAVSNKVQDDADRRFVEKEIGADRVLGHVQHSATMRRVEQGEPEAFGGFVADNEVLWKNIAALSDGVERNWDRYLSELQRVFKANCEWWYNGYYQRQLDDYIDTEFSYADVLAARRS